MKEIPQESLVCAVDLGGTNLRAATVDRNGKIHDRARSLTPRTNDPNEIVSAIASVVIDCFNHAAQRNSRITTVSVVVPGSVHADTGLVVNAPNVPAIVDFGLLKALAEPVRGADASGPGAN